MDDDDPVLCGCCCLWLFQCLGLSSSRNAQPSRAHTRFRDEEGSPDRRGAYRAVSGPEPIIMSPPEEDLKGTHVGSLNYQVDLPMPSWDEKRPVKNFEDQEEDTCPICLVDYTADNPRIDTKCGHHFHLPCLFEWQERSRNTCPVCLHTPLLFSEKKSVSDLQRLQDLHDAAVQQTNRSSPTAATTSAVDARYVSLREETEDSPMLASTALASDVHGAGGGGLGSGSGGGVQGPGPGGQPQPQPHPPHAPNPRNNHNNNRRKGKR